MHRAIKRGDYKFFCYSCGRGGWRFGFRLCLGERKQPHGCKCGNVFLDQRFCIDGEQHRRNVRYICGIIKSCLWHGACGDRWPLEPCLWNNNYRNRCGFKSCLWSGAGGNGDLQSRLWCGPQQWHNFIRIFRHT